MAASPPRPASPASPASRSNVVVPKPGQKLQISPNLEALLEHDELTRRTSGSPTGASHPAPTGFPISLPPPPPRRAQVGRKPNQREPAEGILATRGKEEKRKKAAVVGSDCWPDGLPSATFSPDGSEPTSPCCTRSVTPNPYLNPTPILQQPVCDDEEPTPKPAENPLPSEPRPETPTKAEKMRWMGRDSLNLFSGGLKRAERDVSDERRASWGSVGPVQSISRPSSRLGDGDTATAPSPSSDSSFLDSPRQGPISESKDPVIPHPTAFLPRLSLPSIFSSSPLRLRPPENLAGHDYLSFFDFLSPSSDTNSCTMSDNAQEITSSPRLLESISIPSPNLYSISNPESSASLASMIFAAPPSPPTSPTSVSVQQPSPTHSRSSSPSPLSAVPLSSMKFAPPTPTSERMHPTRLQPASGPPSPYSPLEFAQPFSPMYGVIEKASLRPVHELASDRGRRLKSKKRSLSSSPRPIHHSLSLLPPTTNELDANERAERIRRNRKLARVFGRMPLTEEPQTEPEEPRVLKKSHSPSLGGFLSKQKNHRHAMSVSVAVKTTMKTEPSTPWQTDVLLSPDGRRHSTPLTGAFTWYVEDEHGPVDKDPRSSHDAASSTSFIDMSDEEARDDDTSNMSFLTPHQHTRRRLHQSSSYPSLVESSFDTGARVEAERRRKREKLARLHRFLGSRVPPEAVNGCVAGPPLPPLANPPHADTEHRLRGRRSTPPDLFDRGKVELDDKEKALNVRRAQKMERVFGAPPPQVLFHTRPTRLTVPASQPASPSGPHPFVLTLDIPPSPHNPNQSAYIGKTLHHRDPSDSSRCLLPHMDDGSPSSPSSIAQSFAESLAESSLGYQEVLAQSSVYLNYQHSLNSLVDIIGRDDHQSLVELHCFLHGEVDESPLHKDVQVSARRTSNATSLRSERRHSLPSNASMTSLTSELMSPKISRFQIRRRQAAKLTHFFGVDYRDLIQDILESVERGVEDERKRGTLQPREVEVLMHRVKSLRSINSPDNM